MLRFVRMAVGLILALSVVGRDARAQWGWEYGGWGWGGWGMVATPESAELHAAGTFAMGAGIYNLNTAQANKINAETAIKWNDYMAQVTHESARIYAERRDQRLARNRSLYDARQQRLRDNPGRVDIENGNALNLAVEDLSDPRLGRSALRAAGVKVPASLIATIPFIYASERITLMLEDLRASVKWPEVFDDPRFAGDRKTFDDLAARIRAEANEGEVSPRLMREARAFMLGLGARLQAAPLKDPTHQGQALRFVTACMSVLGLLEKPNIRPALVELRKVQDTSLGSMLGFMHAYNLRFGVATTPDQRRAYGELFAVLDRTRDQVLAEAKLPPAAGTTGPQAAIEFFQDLDRNRPSGASSPQPGKSGTPR